MRKRQPLPSLDLLKGFEAVARHLSFTKAADELCVTQSAVSRQIRTLEDHMGARLFERRTRAIVLTDTGRRYYEALQPVFRGLEQATQKAMTGGATRRLRVTATLSFASLWLVPRLAQFQERHPGIHVHVVADNAMRDLARDHIDVAIRYAARESTGAGAMKLFEEKLMPVCSPALLARRAIRGVEDLAHHTLLHFTELDGRAPWLTWNGWFESMKHPEVDGKGAVYFSHYDQVVNAAQAGQGVALGRVPTIDMLLGEGKLVAALGRRNGALTIRERAYWIMRGENSTANADAQAFVDWLQAQARRTAASRPDG
jgi:DNA-binding transcriptional LysR family regulator